MSNRIEMDLTDVMKMAYEVAMDPGICPQVRLDAGRLFGYLLNILCTKKRAFTLK